MVSNRYRKAANDSQVFYAYTYATAGWLSLQSITLMTAPQMVATALLDETRPPTGERPIPSSPFPASQPRNFRVLTAQQQ